MEEEYKDLKEICEATIDSSEILYNENLVTEDCVLVNLAEGLLSVISCLNGTFVTDESLRKSIHDMTSKSYVLIEKIKS